MNVFLHVIQSVDFTVYRFLDRFAGNWLLDRFAGFEENNNFLKGGLFLAAYVYFWFRLSPHQEERRRAILVILAGTLLGLIVTRTIADLAPYRIRPMFDLNLPHRAHSLPISRNMEDWSSFPSDTAAYFFALACGLINLSRRYAVPILLYTAVWICLPRIFLGEHYLSDILVGAALGAALVEASLKSEWLRLSFAPTALRLMDAKPHVFYVTAFLIVFEMGVLFDDVRGALRGFFHVFSRGHSRDLSSALLAGAGILGVSAIVGATACIIINLPYRRRFSLRGDARPR